MRLDSKSEMRNPGPLGSIVNDWRDIEELLFTVHDSLAQLCRTLHARSHRAGRRSLSRGFRKKLPVYSDWCRQPVSMHQHDAQYDRTWFTDVALGKTRNERDISGHRVGFDHVCVIITEYVIVN